LKYAMGVDVSSSHTTVISSIFSMIFFRGGVGGGTRERVEKDDHRWERIKGGTAR
jgi:hypothetical protein